MARARSYAAVLALALLVLQPALALAADESEPAAPAKGRFVPPGTVVLFDEAHFPVYTVNPDNPSGYPSGNQPRGAYAAYAKVLENAGMTVKTLDYGYYLDSESLNGVKVLVIVCSRGHDPDNLIQAPYTAEESEAVLKFVRNGGGLFLIGDHTTFPPAIFPVAEKFGIEYAQSLMHDPYHNVRNDTSGEPAESSKDVFIYFERSLGNFGDHPIMANVSRVELYRTDYFSKLPDEAVPLITTDSDTYYTDTTNSYSYAPNKVVSAAIPSNTTAGAGRVVVVADTNTFETDENRDEDGDADLFDSDNELYGLQAVEWLADVPEHRGVSVSSAEPDSLGQRTLTHNSTAGTTTTFRLRVENAGNLPDLYDLAVTKNSANWSFGLGYSEVALNSSENRELGLTVLVPAGASVGDRCRLEVTARSRRDLSASDSVECNVVIPSVHELALSCPQNRKSIDAGESARYELWLSNRGNLRERVRLQPEPAYGWGALLDRDLLELDPGEDREFTLTVTPPPEALGGEEGAVAVAAQSTEVPSARALNVTITRLIQRFSMELACPFPELGVDPGSLASFPVSVTNRGNGDDEVTLSLIGGSRWTTYLEPSHFLLPFNTTVETAVVTRAPPNGKANDTQSLAVLAVSVKDPAAQDRLGLRATVNRISKFTLGMDPPTQYVDPGKSGLFNVTVTNTGNTFETVLLDADEPGALSAPEASVSAGESGRLELSVPVAPSERAWTTHLVSVEGRSAQDARVSKNAIATVVVNQVFRIRGELLPAIISMRPGTVGTADLRVWNEGNGPDVASCSVGGASPGWTAGLGSGLLNLEYLGYGHEVLSVASSPNALAGSYNLTVSLSDGAGRAQSLVLAVNILRVHNFSAAVTPETASAFPGKRVDFTLRLDNSGNSAERFTVSSAGKRAGWIIPAEGSAVLNHSSGREIILHVRPGLETQPGKYQLNVTVTGEDGRSREVSFFLKVKEGQTSVNDLPCWIGLAIVLAAVAAVLVVRQRMQKAQKEAELEEQLAGKEKEEK